MAVDRSNAAVGAAEPRQPILIGFADALAAPEVAWSLLEAGWPVVAFARRGSRPALSRCREVALIEVTPPESDADATVADLRRLLAGPEHYRALMPMDDAAIWLCAQIADAAPAPVVVGPTADTAEFALDKRLQVDAAVAAGFSVPHTTVVESMNQLEAITALPVVLKPALPVAVTAGTLRRGKNHVCGTAAELQAAAAAWRESEPLLVQPLISGVGEGLFGLAGPEGLAALSAHRRIRMMNPQGSGSSACVSIAVDEALAAAAQRMLSAVGWRGMFMIEFLRAADGTPWFMEVNGRPWGSMALARRVGLEYPAWAVRQIEEPDFDPHARGRAGQVCRHLGRELVHVLMVMRGPRSVALSGWPTRRETLRTVLRIRRSDRWYNWRPGDTRLLVYDTFNTVRSQIPRRSRG